MLVMLVHDTGVGALIATHNQNLADRMDRVLEVRDGVLVELDGRSSPKEPRLKVST